MDDIEKRFWKKVDKNGDCWIWTASCQRGYGQFWNGSRLVRSHRFSYEKTIGEIPENFVLDHKCRNPKCVNPKHLEPVTFYENLMRGNNRNGIPRRSNFCGNGHEFTPENTKYYGNARVCRNCNIIYQKKCYYEKKGDSPDKRKIKKTNCLKGHPLSGENLGITISSGKTHRRCKICDREIARIKRKTDPSKFRK